MKRTFLYLTMFVLPILLGAFMLVPGKDDKQVSCLECHSDLGEKSSMHYPAEDDCENCHMSNGPAHPEEEGSGFTLADEMPALCFMCHEEFIRSNKHAPVEMGECLICHSPHSSDEPSLLLQANTPAFCGDCHDLSSMDKEYRHEALELASCGDCHQIHESDHPSLLVSEKKTLCMDCHFEQMEEQEMMMVHYPFEDDCSNCHKAHASEHQHLLNAVIPSLCDDCHDVGYRLASSEHKHSMMQEEGSCLKCHKSHASAREGLLTNNELVLCLECHNRPIRQEDRTIANIGRFLGSNGVTHSVFDSEACSACHDPHASDRPDMLVAKFPEGLYATAETSNFELCFTCHDEALMIEERTERATGFRDGNLNLHYVHMSGEKARSCKLCHNVHGSQNKFLVADMVPFGNWSMPMGFESGEHGGSCNTGCHSKYSYSRQLD